VRYWYFSETSYPYLPDEDTYPSIRVTLPNGHMDAVKANALWNRYFDEWLTAEHYGLSLMVNEHHQTATCTDSAAPVTAGVLARITSTARILVLGNPIANRPDPVRVAEEMALVDVISGGRLEVGFVRGVPYEISATNTYPLASTERFWEAHDLIVKAWTSNDGPFSWTGRFFEHRQVNIWPRPYQQPRPPVWITTSSAGNAAVIAEHNHTLATFMRGRATREIFEAYRRRRTELRRVNQLDQLAYCGLVFVADNEKQLQRGTEQILWYARANKVAPPFQAPAGYLPPIARVGSLRGIVGADAHSIRTQPKEELIKDGILFAGTPDQVYKQIRDFYVHVGGFGHLLIMGQAGFLSHEDTVNSIRLFAEEVAPRLDELGPVEPTQSMVAGSA
jgi:alkanesulfonate monooxygenase SsuD/methylene tetrahydromethanopterin reductase-like flavin-dependent oxidoreductase (luciferase family)